MASFRLQTVLVAAAAMGLTCAAAAPAPTAAPNTKPIPAYNTPSAKQEKAPAVQTDLSSAIKKWTATMMPTLPTDMVKGVPTYFEHLPRNRSDILDVLDVDDQERSKFEASLDSARVQVMNIPGYANWTSIGGWNVGVRGHTFKQPNCTDEQMDHVAAEFFNDDLYSIDVDEMRDDMKSVLLDRTRETFVDYGDHTDRIYVHSQYTLENGHPIELSSSGTFNTFLAVGNASTSHGVEPGDATSRVQVLGMHVGVDPTEVASSPEILFDPAFLVPRRGLTVISDIDDTLREAKIYKPDEGALNTFARDFTPWMNMPEAYTNWQNPTGISEESEPSDDPSVLFDPTKAMAEPHQLSDVHFHYLTDAPEQLAHTYIKFTDQNYPPGSFDFRPLNVSKTEDVLALRRNYLERIFKSFPERKFILVGDNTNSDIMKSYPEMARDYRDQVQCILIRNVSATDDQSWFPYDTSGFKKVPAEKYMFFRVPDDIKHLNFRTGECRNQSVPQNVTFLTQGEIIGFKDLGSMKLSKGVLILLVPFGMLLLGATSLLLYKGFKYLKNKKGAGKARLDEEKATRTNTRLEAESLRESEMTDVDPARETAAVEPVSETTGASVSPAPVSELPATEATREDTAPAPETSAPEVGPENSNSTPILSRSATEPVLESEATKPAPEVRGV